MWELRTKKASRPRALLMFIVLQLVFTPMFMVMTTLASIPKPGRAFILMPIQVAIRVFVGMFVEMFIQMHDKMVVELFIQMFIEIFSQTHVQMVIQMFIWRRIVAHIQTHLQSHIQTPSSLIFIRNSAIRPILNSALVSIQRQIPRTIPPSIRKEEGAVLRIPFSKRWGPTRAALRS